MATDDLGTIRGQILLDISNAMSSLTQLRQEHLSTFSAMGQAAGTLDRMGQGFVDYGKTIVGALVSAGQQFGEFERKLDYLSVVAGASDKEVAALGKQIRQLGADTIYTNDEIAVGFTELAKSGVEAKDILGGIGEGITYLGAAADIGLGEAATMMMSVVQTWDMAATEAGRVADVLAGTANASMVEIDDLGVSMKYAGSVASSLGISFDETSTALGLLGKRAIRGSTAGTSLRQIMIGLTGNTFKATKEMERLGIITEEGSNRFFDQNGKVKSLSDSMQVLREATAGMGEEQRIASLKTMFNVRSLPSLLTLLDAGTEGFDDMSAAIQGVAAADVAGARLDNLSGDVEYLKGELDNLILSFGELTSGALRPLVQVAESVIAWFNGLSDGAKGLVINIGLITAGVSLLAGGLLKTGSFALTAASQIGILTLTMQGFSGASTRAAIANSLFMKSFKVGAIGILITLIAALVAGLVYFFTTTEEGQAAWGNFMNMLSGLASTVLPPIMNFFSQLGQVLGPILVQVMTVLTGLFGGVGAGMGEAAGGVGSLLSSGLDAIAELFGVIAQVLAGILLPVITALAPIFSEFGAAIAGVSTNMSGMAGMADIVGQVLVAIVGMATQLIVVFIDLGVQLITAVLGMIPTIVQGFITLVLAIVDTVVAILPTLIDAFINGLMSLIDGIVSIIPALIQAAISLIQALVTALVTALPLLIQAGIQLITGLITAVTTALPTLVSAVVAAIPLIVTALVGAIPALLNAGISLFIQLVTALVVIIPQVITALVEAIPLILNAIVEAIPLILEAAIEAFMSLVNAIPQIIPPLLEAIVSLLPVIIETVISMIPVLIQAAITLFMAIVQAIPQIIGALIPAIISLIPIIISTVISLIPQLIEAAVQLFMAIVDAIPQIVGAIVSALNQLGTDMINGLIAGLQSMGGAVLEAIGGIVDGAIGWAKDLLGIASPSKVFKKIGTQVGDGLAIGISSSEKDVIKATDKMMSGTKEAFADLVEQRKEAQKKLNDLNFKAAHAKSYNPETFKQIAEQQALIAELNKGISRQGAVLNRMATVNKRLREIAVDRDKVTAKLTDAQKKLTDLENGRANHLIELTDNMQKAVAVTDRRTVDGMLYSVEAQIEKVKEFNTLIAQLKSRGLDQQSLNELITEFTSNGNMAAARALAEGSDDAIAQLGELRKQLGVESEKTAKTTASAMYDAGIAAAQGLVKGLQKELDAINAIAKKVADTLTSTIKSQLGIASPSKVMAGVGNDTMAGLILGVAKEKQALQKELDSVASQIAQFNDEALTTKQFEVETMLVMRATDMAALDYDHRVNTDDRTIQLLSEIKKLLTRETSHIENYDFGDIMVSMEELQSIKTLEDFLEMMRVYKRQGRSR